MQNLWDAEADSFDEAPDHGLRDATVRARWRSLISRLVPAAGDALDVGCGTGTLSLVMASLGLRVTGVDLSERMLEHARRKSSDAGTNVTFLSGDAASPPLTAESFDVVLCRHVLWALPDPARALLNWSRLLRPRGRLVLIEGFWHTGVGLHRHDVEAALPPTAIEKTFENLSDDATLWGGPVNDERFVITARMP